MPRLFRRAVRRRSDGRYDVRLTADERDLLSRMMGELRSMLTDDADDPSLRRLFPPTYADDLMRDAAYQAVAGDELRTSRLAAIDTAAETAKRDQLSEDEVISWAQALNALRLVLGTRLDVTEDGDPPAPDDPEAATWALYHYLSVLLEEVIAAIGAD